MTETTEYVDEMAEFYGHLPVKEMAVEDVMANYLTGDERTWEEEAADLDVSDLLAQVRKDGRIVLPITLGHDGRVLDGHHRVIVAWTLGLPLPTREAHLENS